MLRCVTLPQRVTARSSAAAAAAASDGATAQAATPAAAPDAAVPARTRPLLYRRQAGQAATRTAIHNWFVVSVCVINRCRVLICFRSQLQIDSSRGDSLSLELNVYVRILLCLFDFVSIGVNVDYDTSLLPTSRHPLPALLLAVRDKRHKTTYDDARRHKRQPG